MGHDRICLMMWFVAATGNPVHRWVDWKDPNCAAEGRAGRGQWMSLAFGLFPESISFCSESLFLDGIHVLDDLVDQPIFFGFFGRHKLVAIRILFDFFERMPGVLDEDFVQLFLHS